MRKPDFSELHIINAIKKCIKFEIAITVYIIPGTLSFDKGKVMKYTNYIASISCSIKDNCVLKSSLWVQGYDYNS